MKSLNYDTDNHSAITLTTGLSDSDFVYGGNNKLSLSLKDIDKRYSEKNIVVLSSCCTSIIGDDIESVVLHTSKFIKKHINWLDTAGFKSWYWPNGYDMAHHYIVYDIMQNSNNIKKHDKKTANIIGYGNSASVDEKEIGRLLNLCGIEVQYPLETPYTDTQKICNATKADINIMMCKTYGIQFCEDMKSRFGIDYICMSQQMGIHQTEKFLREIGEYFNIKEKIENVIKLEKNLISDDLLKIRKTLEGKEIAISAGHDKAIALMYLANELNLKICYLGLLTYDDLTNEKINELYNQIQYNFVVKVNPQTYEEVELLKKYNPDIYVAPAGLTGNTIKNGIRSLNIHFNDLIGTYFGFKGLINFGNAIINTINSEIKFLKTPNYNSCFKCNSVSKGGTVNWR